MRKRIVGMLLIACAITGAAATAWALEPAESIARKFRNRVNLNSDLSLAGTQLINAIIRYDALLKAENSSKSHGNPEPWSPNDNPGNPKSPVARALENLELTFNGFLDVIDEDYDLWPASYQEYVRHYVYDIAEVIHDLDERAAVSLGTTSNTITSDRFTRKLEDWDDSNPYIWTED